jgi:hypothetical protein
MSNVHGPNAEASRTAGGEPVGPKLEAVVLSVTDADRSRLFYAGLGWRLDADGRELPA